MEKIRAIERKYLFARLDIEYKYIPECIKELSADLPKISKILSENKSNKVVCDLCEKMTKKLEEQLKLFSNKLANIPNVKYLEESDEEYVDKHM